MLSTIKKEMAIVFLRHYIKLQMLKHGYSGEETAIAEITKKLPILAFSGDETEKIGASFISKNKWLFTIETLYPSNGHEISNFDELFNMPAATIEGHATLETCVFYNTFHPGDKLSQLCKEEEAGIDDHVFRLFPKKIPWGNVKNKKFSPEFIEENIEKMDWDNLCKTQNLTDELMRKYADKLSWNHVSQYQKLNEVFMHDFKDKLSWTYLCRNQIMSEQFMEDHKDNMDWDEASSSQEMSLEFISKYKTVLDWNELCRYKSHILNTVFIEQHYEYINMSNTVTQYLNLDESFILRYYDDWSDAAKKNVFSYQNVSLVFCEKHIKEIKSRNQYGPTWEDLFDNAKLLQFNFKGTMVHKIIPIEDVEGLIKCHKGPIMVRPEHCSLYFRTVFVRSKGLYRVVTTDSGFKNWKKRFNPFHSELFTFDELMVLINNNITLPVVDETDE